MVPLVGSSVLLGNRELGWPAIQKFRSVINPLLNRIIVVCGRILGGREKGEHCLCVWEDVIPSETVCNNKQRNAANSESSGILVANIGETVARGDWAAHRMPK